MPPRPPVIVTLTVPGAPSKIVRIDFDDHPVPLIDDQHWKLTLPPGSDVATMAARFKIVLPTTCGNEALDVASVSAQGLVEGKWPGHATIYVDRDGVGSASTVSAGTVVFEQKTTKVLVGSCPTARDIRVEAQIVGQLGASTIVDVKGGHCYELMTSGFPSARLETQRTYERPLDLFLPAEIPADKNVLRRCDSGSLSALVPAATATVAHGVFTAAPPKQKPLPPPKPPKKPRH